MSEAAGAGSSVHAEVGVLLEQLMPVLLTSVSTAVGAMAGVCFNAPVEVDILAETRVGGTLCVL